MILAFLQDTASGKNGTPLSIHVKILNYFASLGNQDLYNSMEYKSKRRNFLLFLYQLIEIHCQEVGIQFLEFSSK